MRWLIVILLIALTACCDCEKVATKYPLPEVVRDTGKSLREAHQEWVIGHSEWNKRMDSLVRLRAIKDSIENVCKERGHIKPNIYAKTGLYCPSYIIETDSSTILVFPACNYIEYKCMRCGKMIEEQEKERRIILWEKEEK